jgi:hypothetical protein
MITPSEIQKKAKRNYSKFLAAYIRDEEFFPQKFPVGKEPKEYLKLKNAVTQLLDQSKENLGYGYEVELKTRKTRRYGEQSLPSRISISNATDYLKLLDKQKEFEIFQQLVEITRDRVPQLEPWLEKYPVRAIEFASVWEDLLKVCCYFQTNPQPNLYIRELPIPIPTKFIEQHSKILRQLLDEILPEDMIKISESDFEKRFNLRYDKHLIRFRVLDTSLQNQYDLPATDISIPLSQFSQLDLQPSQFIIVENKITFLRLPQLPNSFGLFGQGKAVNVLQQVKWLQNCPIIYWGDLDFEGLEMLSQVRGIFPQTRSLMMDADTLNRFRNYQGNKLVRKPYTLPNLTTTEQAVLDIILKEQIWLEQEHIDREYAVTKLQAACLHPQD